MLDAAIFQADKNTLYVKALELSIVLTFISPKSTNSQFASILVVLTYEVAMKCPIDQTVLEITNRNNIEIDYCPQCRGVWLDRGELDKIIERSESSSQPPAQSHQREYHNDGYLHGKHKKRKESFIGDLFDF